VVGVVECGWVLCVGCFGVGAGGWLHSDVQSVTARRCIHTHMYLHEYLHTPIQTYSLM